MSNTESNKIDQMLNEFRLIDIQISNKFKVIYGKYEVWRKIKDYDNHSVSSFGRVRNDKFNRILNPSKNAGGYYFVCLSKNGITKTYLINRLVGLTFLPNHDNKRIVDHVDSKQITNNNILNLRWASNSQSEFNKNKRNDNTTGFKGVSWHKRYQKYIAQICINRKTTHLGYFEKAEDASHAYDTKAKELHGEFFYKNNK